MRVSAQRLAEPTSKIYTSGKAKVQQPRGDRNCASPGRCETESHEPFV